MKKRQIIATKLPKEDNQDTNEIVTSFEVTDSINTETVELSKVVDDTEVLVANYQNTSAKIINEIDNTSNTIDRFNNPTSIEAEITDSINTDSVELSTLVNSTKILIDNNPVINNAIDSASNIIDANNEAILTTIDTINTNKTDNVKNGIKGYIDHIDALGIHGWVIDYQQNPLTLSLNINGVSYAITALWHNRTDVADSFGADFIQSGFTIKIPPELYSIFSQACINQQVIKIIANNTPLINRNNHFELVKPASENSTELKKEQNESTVNSNTAKNTFLGSKNTDNQSTSATNPSLIKLEKIKKISLEKIKKLSLEKAKKKANVVGYVETIDNIVFQGWAIDKDRGRGKKDAKKEPLTLYLSIDGVGSYLIDVNWYERGDIVANFGNEFVQSGYWFVVPDRAIDAFLLAQKNKQAALAANKIPKNTVHVLAKGVRLNAENTNFIFNTRTLPENSFEDIVQLNAVKGVQITGTEFQKLLTARDIDYPIAVSSSDNINAYYYYELAKQKLIEKRLDEGRRLLKLSLAFANRAETIELLGNTYIELGDYETAAAYYEGALRTKIGSVSNWLFINLIKCTQLITQPRYVVEATLKGIENSPEKGALLENLDDAIKTYWLKQLGDLDARTALNEREALLVRTQKATDFIYNSYLRAYGAKNHPKKVTSCNLQRILIVGDFHIAQCIRYRIDQKVEQLKEAGKEVTTVSWTELHKAQNELIFHDVVIFYRVPAEPVVLKAMAQVNATGKLSFYEIDDLLFDSNYPPALETYGGYLNLSTYLQLLRGMASFHAAAQYCRFGIASTQPLADKLQTLVFDKHCFVHRNGLDSLNVFKSKVHSNDKAHLSIFYGSGTMAHNSDFIELALPALDKLLAQYPHVNLVITGYLKLPADFLQRHSKQVKQMPPVKSIKAYWALLERADINLAVLHDDEINGCKSELKWFEAACVGIPSVLSSTANYRDVIEEGVDALLASNAQEWYSQLKRLIDNPQLRTDMAEKAQAHAKAKYSVATLSTQLSALLAHAVYLAQDTEVVKRQKIALVNVFFPPQAIGGATRVIADNFDVLQRDYADQFELTAFTSDAEFKGHVPAHTMSLYNYEGVRVYRSSAVWREHMDWHCYDKQMGQLFADFLVAEQPDLVHFHCVQRLTGAVLEVTREAKIPYLVTVHDAWWISDYQFLVDADNKVYPQGHPDPYESYTPPKGISMVDSIERILYLKGLLNDAKAVLTVSQSFADIYRNNEVEHIRVNKNGISDSINWQAKNTTHTAKVVCGHIGGMAEHKGYFLLKNAIEMLQPKNIELLVVDHSKGEGYRHKELWGKVPVTFVGRVNQNAIVDLYQHIDVLFAPSTWPESYGLVTREAAACGCWVVASNMGGIGEDVIDGVSGFVIEPTQKALITCLKSIDAQPERFKELAPEVVLRLASQQVLELVQIYKEQADTDYYLH
ncbi:MAG: glycosyltransferase [Methylococcaceae bacterium]